MEFVSGAFNVLYQFTDSFALLVLASLGLAVIFGMMGVVNLAHGELIMSGAYVTTFLANKGVALPLAILVAAVTAGIIGAVLERLIVHRLYGRLIDSVVATWGIGLVMSQGALILFGPSIPSVSTPLGSFTFAGSTYSWYRLVLGVCALVLLLLMYLLFMRTKYGVQARATIQSPEMARSLGIDTRRMYTLTFALGAALAGLTGGLYAPTTTVVPTFGSGFIVEAFVTVIVGGANVLIGTPLAGAILGGVNSLLAGSYGTFIARVGLLLATIVVIRVLPRGISGLVARGRS
ncbi:MAG TPA: branched-chain amino acid ABC transporter permease [Candidatus Limnocylindria bacterium]|jgi:urea ABC transporter permease protein UrtB|nr:branched-chain amino acid ABC transporter permease [Candidatus Limnocylindria bacterium]